MPARPMLAAMLLAALMGCGSGTPTQAFSDTVVEAPLFTATVAPSATSSTAPTSAQYAPATAPETPTPSPTPLPDLTASITASHKAFLSLGKFSCTVRVVNPSSAYRSGTLTVSFLNGSKASKTAPVIKKVSLGPNDAQDLVFTETRWLTSSATVSIKSDPLPEAPLTALEPVTTPADALSSVGQGTDSTGTPIN